MLNQRKSRLTVAAGAGLCFLLIGAMLATQSDNWLGQSQEQLRAKNQESAVFSLVSLSPAQRMVQLQAIAQLPKSPDSARARYLLASGFTAVPLDFSP